MLTVQWSVLTAVCAAVLYVLFRFSQCILSKNHPRIASQISSDLLLIQSSKLSMASTHAILIRVVLRQNITGLVFEFVMFSLNTTLAKMACFDDIESLEDCINNKSELTQLTTQECFLDLLHFHPKKWKAKAVGIKTLIHKHHKNLT